MSGINLGAASEEPPPPKERRELALDTSDQQCFIGSFPLLAALLCSGVPVADMDKHEWAAAARYLRLDPWMRLKACGVRRPI